MTLVPSCPCLAKLIKKAERATLLVPPPLFIYFPFLIAGLTINCGVALAAVHRPPVSGLERHLGVFTTRAANSIVHYPLALVAIAITTMLLLVGLSAFRTTLGLVCESFGSKELLLTSAKGETCAAVHTLKGLIYVGHG